MTAPINRQILLAARPDGVPKVSDFKLVESPVPEPGDGQLLVRTIWLSLDPYMRLRISDDGQYYPPVPIGDVVVGGAVSRVIESRHRRFKPGDIVDEYSGWQDYAVVNGARARKVDPKLGPLSTAIGVLGMPGLTAYLGLTIVGQPAPGDTVVVSAAAGAVGAVAGQVAKIAGCRVIGIAGSEAKVGYLTGELGFDAGIDYKRHDVASALDDLCPTGIDVYFDNVGGAVSAACYAHLAHGARVVVCGGVSQYNAAEPPLVPSSQNHIMFTEATVRGFNIFSHGPRYEPARKRLAAWFKDGRLKYKEDIVEGLENAPGAFLRLFEGGNFGKLLVKVSEE